MMLLMALGPMCLRTLMRTLLFTSKSAASRKMNQLVDRGKVKYTHPIRLEELREGKSEVFWTNRVLKDRKHEAYVMEVITSLWPCDARTGSDVGPWLADADLIFNRKLYHLEMDLETMSQNQVHERWKLYLPDPLAKEEWRRKGCQNNLLIVTLSQLRAERMVKWSQILEKLAYVTTIQELVAAPWGQIWTGMDGNKHAIERGNVAGNGEGQS